MGRGRPKKYASGSLVWAGSLPANIVRQLRTMPNASEWVSGILVAALDVRKMDLTMAEITQTDQEMLALKKELLSLERKKASLEDALRAQQSVRNSVMEARQDLIERLQHGDAEGYNAGPKDAGWYEARTDVLVACGFESADEALEWQKDAMKNWRR